MSFSKAAWSMSKGIRWPTGCRTRTPLQQKSVCPFPLTTTTEPCSSGQLLILQRLAACVPNLHHVSTYATRRREQPSEAATKREDEHTYLLLQQSICSWYSCNGWGVTHSPPLSTMALSWNMLPESFLDELPSIFAVTSISSLAPKQMPGGQVTQCL